LFFMAKLGGKTVKNIKEEKSGLNNWRGAIFCNYSTSERQERSD